MNWDIKRAPTLRRYQEVQTGSWAMLDPRLIRQENKSAAKRHFKSTSLMRLSSGEPAGTALLTLLHICGIGLQVLVKNYCKLCSSISVRSKNSISWQIEVALIRKLRFHTFEGEMWSDTSKGFRDELSWVGGWWQKEKHLSEKGEPNECGARDALLCISWWHMMVEEMCVKKRTKNVEHEGST